MRVSVAAKALLDICHLESPAQELGDKLREKGAARKEAIESGGAVGLVRSISTTADTTVKANVDIVRRPTQQVGGTLHGAFQGGIAGAKAGERKK